ncbi:PEP-CTERM sorting domain-containing protein [Planctomycetota bacterium]
MKRRSTLTIVMVFSICVTTGISLALPWDVGDPGSTHQEWYFNTTDNPSVPEVDLNPFGDSLTCILGLQDYSIPVWTDGIWQADILNVEVYVPNGDIVDADGHLWIEVGFQGEITLNTVVPASGIAELISEEVTVGINKTLISQWSVSPNPGYEVICYRIAGTVLDQAGLDYLIVDTISFLPEPATICLLGLAAMFLLRKRPKKR